MKKILPFLAGCLFLNTLSGQNFTASNLPIVIISTNGADIPDDPKIPATLKIIDNGPGQTNHLADPPNNFDGQIGIELRGATSQGYPKKPYDIEIRDDTGDDLEVPVLGLPKESDFALIQPLNDKTLFRDVLAYKLAGQCMDWAPRTRFCEVVINGSYEGVYAFTETIKRDKNRVNVAKLAPDDLAGDSLTGGYILKMDKTNGGGGGGDWPSAFPPFPGAWQTTWFQSHYPKYAQAAPEQRQYIENHMADFENALFLWQPNSPGTPVYEQWIDVDSWVNYLLVNELSKNVDGYRLSAYFYKDRDDKDPLLHMGPVWDFNISFGIGYYCEGEPTYGWMKDFNTFCPDDGWVIQFWWEKLCRDTNFQQRVAARWAELRQNVWSDDNLTSCVDSLVGLLSEPQQRNFQRWQVLGQNVWPNVFVGQTWQQEVNYLKDWMLDRAAWMDGNIQFVGPAGLLPFLDILYAPIFPNPLTGDAPLTIEFSASDPDDPIFSVFDAIGRAVMAPQRLPQGQRVRVEFPMQNLSNGLYFYKIETPGKILRQGKFEIAR